ncbi:unnamed protein product, partial [Brassica oleracea var. botrytis]
MKFCVGRTSVIDVAASVAQKRSELARNSVIDAIASMVRNRSTVVFYYSSSDRFTTTYPSLGRENRIKRLGLHNSIGPPRCRQSHGNPPLLHNFELFACWVTEL